MSGTLSGRDIVVSFDSTCKTFHATNGPYKKLSVPVLHS